jgi:dipeptidyl aminopeptidase/acylaminoacyl peptidase
MVSPMHAFYRASALLTSAIAAAWTVPAFADCAGWNPLAVPAPRSTRVISARDLIELVNIGRPDAEPLAGPSPVGLSPDGKYAAMVLQRADLATNSYCQALIVVDVTGREAPRMLDSGGDYLMVKGVLRGMYMSIGFPRLNIARWSRDGRSIAFLKRLDNRTQVWRASLDGKPAAMMTHADDDINQWAWSPDGRSLVYSFDTGRVAAEAAVDREGVTGWHYDARMAPHIALRPQIPAPLAQAEMAVDPATGMSRPASSAERDLLARGDDEPLDKRRIGATGLTAWAERTGPTLYAGWKVRVADRRGEDQPCTNAMCSGKIKGLWWSSDGGTLSVLTAEGWNNRFTALYRWAPGNGQPMRVLRTDDVIQDCVPRARALLCLRQGSLRPPRLVAIDIDSGSERILFDPNPTLFRFRLGSVQRLEWQTDKGRQVYGDLALPPGYTGGKLPVIVTQYWSRGFLRGGTGNDYPIQLFAARGFAVLSISRPASAASDDPTVLTPFDDVRVETRNWAERRNINSAINKGLDLLIAKGIADPSRLGITGLSDGGSAVRFALINTPRFAAAALSTCCVDDTSDDVVGSAWEKQSVESGYPPAYPINPDFWRPYSFALNADRMTTPLLMQLADYEVLTALHGYTALHSQNQPVDLYFFPNEFHNKWQPEHRAAVWDRDLDWFSFWLQGREDAAPDKIAMFARWRAWKRAREERARQPVSTSPGATARP